MKRVLAYTLACMLLLCGCSAIFPQLPAEQTAQPALSQEPVPVPTATPRPVTVLIVSDCSREQAAAFFEAAQAALSGQSQWVVETADNGFFIAAEKLYDGVIALRTSEDTGLTPLMAAGASGVSVTLADLANMPASLPEGLSYSGLLPEETAQRALMEAIQFPPHDTPVRMAGLFTKQDSAGDKAFSAAVSKGMVLKKSVHYETDPVDSATYMQNLLDGYVAGLIDAVYAENMTLAKIALDALRGRGRDDIDVFCVPAGMLAEQTPYLAKWYFPLAMGVTLDTMGSAQAGELLRLMEGGEPRTGMLPIIKEYDGE